MAVEGVYFSKMDEEYKFMWAFVSSEEDDPAHFGGQGPYRVIEKFADKFRKWAYCESEKKYLVLPKDIIVWTDQ